MKQLNRKILHNTQLTHMHLAIISSTASVSSSFHTPSVSFRSFFIRFILIIIRIYVPRIVDSHTVPVLFHSFCSHTLGFFRSFRIRWKGRMRDASVSIWVFTHAFTRHDIELAASIYFFIRFFFSFHLSAFLHIFAKRFGSIQLIFMCFAFCCFWLYNWLALLFSFIFMATTFVFTDVRCTLLLSCNDDACKFICGFSCWNSRWF